MLRSYVLAPHIIASTLAWQLIVSADPALCALPTLYSEPSPDSAWIPSLVASSRLSMAGAPRQLAALLLACLWKEADVMEAAGGGITYSVVELREWLSAVLQEQVPDEEALAAAQAAAHNAM